MQSSELNPRSVSPRPTSRASKGRFVKRGNPGGKFTVTTRRQTPDEARHYTTAYRLFIAEMVRIEINRVKGKS